MSEQVYSRDPQHPDEVRGPFTVAELKVCVMRGELRRSDQLSIDRKAWMNADAFEPDLFAGGSGDRNDSFSAALGEGAQQTWLYLRARFVSTWQYLREVALFYWFHRSQLWQLFSEYAPFFKEHGNRREIRVSQDDENDKVQFDGEQWNVELPDCCVVCGEPADRAWNSEQRTVEDLTWPLLAPLNGLLLGVLLAVFFWTGWSRWLVLLGLFVGFLLGYRLRGEVPATIRFRRCREHLNKTGIPTLRMFRNLLIIGVGDRSVWRQFHYGRTELETPIAAPPPLPSSAAYSPPDVSEKPEPPPRTIKLVGDDDVIEE